MLARTLSLTAPPQRLEVRGPIGLPTQLALAWWRSRTRAQGAMPSGQEDALRSIECVWRGVRADTGRLDLYRAVCGYPPADAAPAAWLETLFLGPMAAIVLSDCFPFSPLGLIHIAQVIVLRRPIRIEESFDAVARLSAARETSRGFELDLALELRSSNDIPWSGLATLLSRNPATRARGRRDASPEGRLVDSDPGWRETELDLSANLGRRYARASGDWNPHHLWPITARALGYRKPIAHGMWTLGRVLAMPASQLATPWVAEARFQRPAFLPGRVTLRWQQKGHETAFEVRDSATFEPHLSGRVFTADDSPERAMPSRALRL